MVAAGICMGVDDEVCNNSGVGESVDDMGEWHALMKKNNKTTDKCGNFNEGCLIRVEREIV